MSYTLEADPGGLAANVKINGATVAQFTTSGLVTTPGPDVASAATLDLTSAPGNGQRVTGTVATSSVLLNSGQQVLLVADGAWPLTYHATTNNISGGVSRTLVAGDQVLYRKDLSGVVRGIIFPANDLAVVKTWLASQRGAITTDNDLSFDLNVTNNFKCTPTAGGTLTFTNIASAAGQSGNILLINGANYAITAAATTKVGSSTLGTISATGTYWLSYMCDGTNVYVSNTGALV